MKYCTIIALTTLAIVGTMIGTSAATNSTWGQRGYYDRKIFSTEVVKKSDFMRVITVDVDFPGKKGSNPYTISEVRVIDHKKKDGGYAQLRKGGPGFRDVTLHIKSDRNHGLKYSVEIYGK